MRSASIAIAAAMFGAASLLAAPSAQAATSRIIYTTATNTCQPATPLELGGLRFRPLGIYNNKTDSIYISCSFDTEFNADTATSDLRVWFDNQGTSTQTPECTASGGSRDLGVTTYAGQVAIAAGAIDDISFANIDKGNGGSDPSFVTIQLTCLLPPKVEMGLIRFNQESLSDGL